MLLNPPILFPNNLAQLKFRKCLLSELIVAENCLMFGVFAAAVPTKHDIPIKSTVVNVLTVQAVSGQ